MNRPNSIPKQKNMQKIFLLLLSLVFLINCSWAQNNISISGYVTDKQTGEKLVGAYIVDSLLNIHASTNNFGLFSLSVNKGSYHFQISYVGYRQAELTLLLTKDTLIQIRLNNDSYIKEVTVSAENPNRIQSLNSPGLKNLPLKMLKQLPVIMGEKDLLKTIQLLPGIQSGSEANTGLYVRGGETDQNQILLDGAEIFNPNHLFGFFSLFNDDAIKSVKVYTSDFPAQYNGRLSSVVDIRMKDGNSYKTKVNGSIGLISSKIQVEGPILKEKLTYIISYRRTYLDLFAKPIIKHFTSYVDAGYFFFDLNARIHWKINDRNSFYLSNYSGQDKGFFATHHMYGFNPPEKNLGFTETKNKQDVNWGNNLVIFRYERLFSPRLFMNLKTSLSDYKYHSLDYNSNLNVYWQNDLLIQDKSEYSFKTNSSIKKRSFSLEFDYFLSNHQHLSFGQSVEQFILNPSIESFIMDTDTGNFNQKFNTFCSYTFIEDEIKLWDKLVIKPGVSFSYYISEKPIPKLSKRLHFSYQVHSRLKVYGGYSEMSQYLHLLTLARINLASDLWLSSSGDIKPSESINKSIGINFIFSKTYSLSIDIYQRSLKNLLSYKEGLSFTSHYNSYSDMVSPGNGKASGVEFNIEKSSGSYTGMISYCYSKSERYFKEINQGKPFRAQYDRPHNLKLLVLKSLGEKWSFGIIFNIMSGSLQTMGSARYISWFDYGESPYDKILGNVSSTQDIIIYRKNSYRLPVNHRLDLSVSYNMLKGNYKSSINFGLYNAYNAKNTYLSRMELISIGNNKYIYEIDNKSLFPMIPFISYSFGF